MQFGRIKLLNNNKLPSKYASAGEFLWSGNRCAIWGGKRVEFSDIVGSVVYAMGS
jgi:hypothetical protein